MRLLKQLNRTRGHWQGADKVPEDLTKKDRDAKTECFSQMQRAHEYEERMKFHKVKLLIDGGHHERG